MAKEEQVNLSNYIKNVHQKLRHEARNIGSEKAWEKHCENKEILQCYASAMHQLATVHWDLSCTSSNSKAASRIDWVYNACLSYFRRTSLERYRKEEIEIANKIKIYIDNKQGVFVFDSLKLLDVGSCYNPFQKFECFDVIPIDLAPASSDVFQCDFLHVKVAQENKIVSNMIMALTENSFDIVVFSLFLEYLPTPAQRYLACDISYKLLKPEGLLFIITPDSKHMNANMKIIKTWRYMLAKLGFSRIKYEKLHHLHCMVFRKCLRIEISQRWAALHQQYNFYDSIAIPQDFNINNADNYVQKGSNEDVSCKCDPLLFLELPHISIND